MSHTSTTPADVAAICRGLLSSCRPKLDRAARTGWHSAAAATFYQAGVHRHRHYYLAEIIGNFDAAGSAGDPPHAVRERQILKAGADPIEHIGWYYRTAIALHPAFAEPRYNLAMLLKRAGRRAEALELLLQGAQLAPHPRAAGNALVIANAYWEAAGLEAARGRQEEAERLYREALQRHGNFGPEHRQFPRLLRRLGKIEEAADHFDRLMAYSHHYAPEFIEPAYAANELLPRHSDGAPVDPGAITPVSGHVGACYWAHLYFRMPAGQDAINMDILRAMAGWSNVFRTKLLGPRIFCSPALAVLGT